VRELVTTAPTVFATLIILEGVKMPGVINGERTKVYSRGSSELFTIKWQQRAGCYC